MESEGLSWIPFSLKLTVISWKFVKVIVCFLIGSSSLHLGIKMSHVMTRHLEIDTPCQYSPEATEVDCHSFGGPMTEKLFRVDCCRVIWISISYTYSPRTDLSMAHILASPKVKSMCRKVIQFRH